MSLMELRSTEFSISSNTREFLYSAEFACLEESCRIATQKLSTFKQGLSIKVATRCLELGQLLGLSGTELVRLEIAAQVHRLGESFIDDHLSNKSFFDMTHLELHAYFRYPLFSALRLSQFVSKEFYDILLHHRDYYSCAGMLNMAHGDKIPLSARILCVATEYEELVRYKGCDPIKQDIIQRRMMKNTIGRYDSTVLDALMLTIAAEYASH
jgi:response regulator RpfG family c-di-GMP phosphodiesterase